MTAFSSGAATLALKAIALDAYAKAKGWLEAEHPGQLERAGPGEVVDCLLQGIMNAWAELHGDDGGPVVHAFAHNIACMVFQQEDHPRAWANFEHLFRTYYAEQIRDFTPKGTA